MKKVSQREKEVIEEKLRKEGIEEKKPVQVSISDDQKEQLKKMIAESEHHKFAVLDKDIRSRKGKKKA